MIQVIFKGWIVILLTYFPEPYFPPCLKFISHKFYPTMKFSRIAVDKDVTVLYFVLYFICLYFICIKHSPSFPFHFVREPESDCKTAWELELALIEFSVFHACGFLKIFHCDFIYQLMCRFTFSYIQSRYNDFPLK